MKLQRTFIYIAGVFFAVGFAASQASAGTGTLGCNPPGLPNLMEIAVRIDGKSKNPNSPISTGANKTAKSTTHGELKKGTAPKGTQFAVTVTYEVFDGTESGGVLLDSVTEPGVTIKTQQNFARIGGPPHSQLLAVTQCTTGKLTFVAEYRGQDEDGEDCVGKESDQADCN